MHNRFFLKAHNTIPSTNQLSYNQYSSCAESLNWNINLENLTLLSPSCASQQGRVHFTMVSNYEMSSVTVLVDNGADPTNAVFNNINLTTIIFDENLSLNNYLEPVNTTNNIDNNGDGIPDVLSFGNPYNIRVTATIDGCTRTFYIPNNVGNDLNVILENVLVLLRLV